MKEMDKVPRKDEENLLEPNKLIYNEVNHNYNKNCLQSEHRIYKEQKLKMSENYEDYNAIEEVNPEAITFNFILDSVGGYGRQQRILFYFLCVLCVFYSFILFGQMFMSLTPPDHWCDIPQQQKEFLTEQLKLLNPNLNPEEIEAEIKNISIPKELGSEDVYEKCLMYDVDWNEYQTETNFTNLRPDSSWPTRKCSHGWAYDFSLYYPTITSELNWVCDSSHKQPLSTSIFFIGSIIGGPLFGWLADVRGRKFAYTASNFLSGLSGVAAATSPSFTMYCICLFVLGFNAYPQINIMYILVMEFVTPEHRSFVGLVPFMVFMTLGFTILPWIAYIIADWRTLGLVLYCPLLFTPLLWKFIPESVRWLVGRGRREEAIKTLEYVAATNGIEVKEKLSTSIKSYVNNVTPTASVSVIRLLRTPRLRKHFVALCLLLVSIRLLYDAHVRIAQTIDYNIFITFSLSSAIEVFSGLGAYLLADSWGRKWTIVCFFFLSGIIEIARVVIPDGTPYAELILHIVGKITITLAIDVAFMLPVEVLPTVARSQAAGFIHTMGFMIAFFSPYIVYLARSCHQCALMVLSFVAIFGGLVVLLLLPETKNKDLPDTLEEGENFCREQDMCAKRRNKKNNNEV